MKDKTCSKNEGSTSNSVTDTVNTDIPDPTTNTARTVTGSNSSEVTEPRNQTVQNNNNIDIGTYSNSTIDYEHPVEIPENANSEITSPEAANSNAEHSKSESNGEPELVICRKRHHKRVKYIKSSDSERDSDENIHKRPKQRKLNSKSYPSAARIQAQKRPTQQPKYTLRSSITCGGSKLKQKEKNSTTDDDKHPADDSKNNDSGYAPSPPNVSENESNSKTSTNTNTKTDCDSSSSSTSTKTSRGEWNTTTRGVRQYKRKRKFKCPSCKQVENSVADMNNHFRTTHGKLSCQTCQRLFGTPSALGKHSYIHKNILLKCNKCPKSYAFASQLASHKISHRSLGMYQCMTCQTYCKNKSDLTKLVGCTTENYMSAPYATTMKVQT